MQMMPYDDRDGEIWWNGKFVPWREAKTHVINQGLHYAGSVFEGCRAYNEVIFKNYQHCQRLKRSASLLGFEIPYSAEELEAASNAVIKQNNLKDAYVRPFAFRGSKVMGISGKGNEIHTVIAAWEWPSYFSEEIKQRGLKLSIAKWKRPSPETAPYESKAAGLYMICTLSKMAAEAEGCDDALMYDYRGYVAEATAANIFFVMNDEIHTPVPDCFLNGITRLTAIEIAKNMGIPVIERHIKADEVARATEVFVTGTAAEIMPVGQIGENKFMVGSATKKIMQAYHDMVRGLQNNKQKVA